MKKLLLTLSLVLGFITLAQATDVTLPGTDKKWYDETYTWNATKDKVTGSVEKVTGSVEGFTLDINKGSSQTDPKAPSTDKDYNAVVVYAGSNLKVTAPQGRSISKLVVNAGSGTNKDANTICVNNNTNNNWTVSTTGTKGTKLVATLTATTAQQSITFYGAAGTTGKQLRIKSMVITLSDGSEITPTVETPEFSVAAGAVEKGTEVAILCATIGATIRYTTNGDDVTETSDVYSTAIVINEAMTIKAKAFKEGMTASEQAVASYSLSQSVDPEQPVITSTATFNFSDPTTLTPSYDANANHDVDGVIFSNNNVTVVNKKNDASNTAKLWANGHQYRIYSGSLLTIAVPKGYKFTSVQFDCSEGLAGLNAFTPGSYNSTTGVLTFDDVVANKVTCVLSAKVFIKSITVNFAKIEVAAPVMKLPEDYGTASDSPVNLTNYTSGATNKYFDVTVTWDEGLTLVYSTTSRRTQLNDVELKYPEQPSKPAAVRAAAESEAPSPLENPITGEISEGTSAKFSFASLGEFKCYTKDAAGNVSDPIIMTFEGVASGVEDIAADAEVGEAQFFNMQGVRVANPAAGYVYIKVQGDKATKVLVK